MSASYALMWFRQDLRIFDNTAFSACCEFAQQHKQGVIAVVYLTPTQLQSHRKSLWQIDLILRQIQTLKQSLAQLNVGLIIRTVTDFSQQAEDIIALCQQQNVSNVFANNEYLVNEVLRDQFVNLQLNGKGINLHWYNDSNVVAPKCIITDKGLPYKVFTPFYKRWLSLLETSGLNIAPIPNPITIKTVSLDECMTDTKEKLTIKDFYQNHFIATAFLDKQLKQVIEFGERLYPAGEETALSRLGDFLTDHITHYNTARDVPSLQNNLGSTSRLSPYLAIGALSPRICYMKAMQLLQTDEVKGSEKDIMRWVSELAWRDFYYDVIVNRPDIVKGAAFLRKLEKSVAWRYDKSDFEAWYQGKTGVPLVDAAMRCLNATGFMHNRLRMVVAMYLAKNLLIDWRWGEAYFIQHLVDGDFASNNGGWQWSASIGTDAQPYFRVMNPFSQAATHDAEAKFIKHWLPELANVPANIINDEQKLQTYLKQNSKISYPKLTTPTKVSRAMAIDAFKQSKNPSDESQ